MNAVTNAGPLMALAKLGQVDLLSKLYQPVWLATAIHHEVVSRGLEQGFPEALVAQMAFQRGQLVLVNVAESELPPEILALPVGSGEKQTLHLARQHHADLVLLDDAQARRAAQSFGLTVKGTLGVIVQAVRARHLTHADAKTLIEAILARDDIWIAEELCRQTLAAVGDTSAAARRDMAIRALILRGVSEAAATLSVIGAAKHSAGEGMAAIESPPLLPPSVAVDNATAGKGRH